MQTNEQVVDAGQGECFLSGNRAMDNRSGQRPNSIVAEPDHVYERAASLVRCRTQGDAVFRQFLGGHRAWVRKVFSEKPCESRRVQTVLSHLH